MTFSEQRTTHHEDWEGTYPGSSPHPSKESLEKMRAVLSSILSETSQDQVGIAGPADTPDKADSPEEHASGDSRTQAEWVAHIRTQLEQFRKQ